MPPSSFTTLAVGGMPILPGAGLIPPTTGSVFFVSSGTGNSGNLGTDSGQPFATISQAISACTANKGDVVIVMPGHAETVAAAGGITVNKAGVSIIGLGSGTLRPTLTFSATASTSAVSAANVTMRNFAVTCSITAVVSLFNITGAFFAMDAVDYVDTASMSPLSWMAATGVDTRITNSSWVASATQSASTQQWIIINAAHRFKCLNCFASLNGAAASANGIIVGATAASNDVDIAFNRFMSVGSTSAVGLSMFSGTTGLVRENHVATAKTAIAGNIALASCYGMNNYSSHVANKNGLLDPVVDA